MRVKFDKNQLESDILVLEGKGVEKDAAETIAQFKQVLEYAAYFQDSCGFASEDEASEEIRQILDYANSSLEDLLWEVAPIFETEESVVATAA